MSVIISLKMHTKCILLLYNVIKFYNNSIIKIGRKSVT